MPQASSVKQPARVPLVTTIQSRDESFNRDARLVNAIAELEPLSKEYWVEKRIGYTLHKTMGGAGLGMYNWQGVFYAVFGNKLYKNDVQFGTVDSTTSYVFCEMLGTGWLVLMNGVKVYYTDGSTLNEISTFLPVLSGALVVGTNYEIVSAGTTDFTVLGAADNQVGTQFTATGLGDPLDTGQVAIVATSLVAGQEYQIYSLGDTDFTLVGADINEVGHVFTATGPGTGTGAVIIPNLPRSLVKGLAYLDGTLYVMDERARVYGTSTVRYGGIGGFDDPRLWDSLNMIPARTEPDRGVSTRKHLSYVMAFKQWTVEAFYDAKVPTGSPLLPVQGAQCLFGCASADSIQSLDGTLFWLTFNRTVSPQIARMDELRVQIISTPPVERLLDQIDFTQIFSWSLKHGGHRFYGLTIKTSNLTLVYDIDQQLWYHWTDANGNYWPIVARAYDEDNHHILQHETDGRLYLAEGDYEYPTDNGEIVPVDIYTPNFDAGVDRRKMLSVMRFNADQKNGSMLFVRCSDDDYQTWTNFRRVDLSQIRPVLTNCGTFYRRAWHFRHFAATPFRIRSVDLQFDLGTL